MTLDQMKYFYEAARFQHVGKAAKFIHISPSAISAAVASLESELGCKLFDRMSKSIILTDAGRRLKEEAEKLFDHVAAIRGKISEEASQLRGNYRLGASHFLASHCLTRAWSQLQNQHIELSGEVCSLPTAQVIREVIAGALDMGVCFSPFQHPELKQDEIYRGRLVVAVRDKHPLLKFRGRKAMLGLNDFPAVIHKGQPGVDLCEAHPIFDQYGVVPQIRLSFDSDACAIERVVSSDSWTMIPDLVAQAYSKQVSTIHHPADWDASFTVALVYRKDRETNPVVQAIRSQLKSVLSKSRIINMASFLPWLFLIDRL